MNRTGAAVALAITLALTGCASTPAPTPTVTVTVTSSPEPAPTVTVTAAAPSAPDSGPTEADLTTDAGLCAADAEMTNLELNDAIAPMLGYPAERDLRTADQDAAIRDYKNAAFERACPARAG